ncbi:MAG: hypothetical protein JJU02_14995 [Cryomorphaceae bacterium]|nr:hypothetical protein [Cryomorphaceae bacterium]
MISVYGIKAQEKWRIQGYVKEIPMMQGDNKFSTFTFDNITHNRINLWYYGGKNWSVHAGQRTRYFFGESFGGNPFFKEFLKLDQGPLPLSHLLVNEGSHTLHTITDRLYFNWEKGKWHIRAGRQRINWGINMVHNPNDLFNNYSFFDFDYDERPGADAIRVSYYTGALSRWEVAYSPGFSPRESVGAIMRAFNHNGYDFQVVGGYFHHRAALGGGWAGSVKGMGFKGEFTFFQDLESQGGQDGFNMVAAISADYQFKNGVFWVNELVYNQARHGQLQQQTVLFEPMRADNVAFSEWAVISSFTYSHKMVHSFSLSGMYFPTEQWFFVSPNYTRSLHANLDLTLLSQIFVGGSELEMSVSGYNLIAMIKWNF